MEVRKRGLHQSPFFAKDTLPFPIYILSLLEILIEIQSDEYSLPYTESI